jgi:tetratricopeptide (TPR) repeat protein
MMAILVGVGIQTAPAANDVNKLIESGVANCELGKFDQAIADFSQAMKSKPQDPGLYVYRGRAKWAKGQNSQAIDDFNQALKIDPNHAKAYDIRGQVYGTMEQFDKAVADLRQAKSLGHKVDPDFLKLMEKKAAAKK